MLHFLEKLFQYIMFLFSGLMKKSQNNHKEEIRYFIIMLVTYLHEILGHVLIILQRNLFDRKIKSSETKGIMYSKSSNKRGYESGEYLHVKLFGKLLKELSLEEVCFLLDIKIIKKKVIYNFKKIFQNVEIKNLLFLKF